MGQISTLVTDRRIEPSQVYEWMPSSGHGAGNVFLGFVRDFNLGKKVVNIHYDAFAPLAEKVFRTIAEEAQEKWGKDLNLLIVHRTGKLEIGDISVAIYATSRHRDESYLASRYVIEEIKTRAPIWKKECYENGETDWVRGHALCRHGDHGDHPRRGEVHTNGHRQDPTAVAGAAIIDGSV